MLTAIAARAAAADPAALGWQLLMLIEGATVVADHRAAPDAADRARLAALTLLRAATSRPANGTPSSSHDAGESA